jgi:hypothetical protein
MTTTFSTFSASRLAPVHPTPTAPISFSLFNVHKQVPSPTYPNPLSHRSCTSPHLFLSDSRDGPTIRSISRRNRISLVGVENYVFRPRTSDDESALAFHGSIFDPRRVAIKLFILKRNVFSLTSPVNSGSPPTLSDSNSLLCHLPLCKAKRTKRRSTCQSFPAPPIPRLTLVGSTSSLSCLLFPTPSFLPSPTFPSSSYSHSHVPHTVSRRPPPRSCITAECVQDDQSSVFPPLYEEDFNMYVTGVDLKTDIVNGVKELRSCTSGMLPIDDLSHKCLIQMQLFHNRFDMRVICHVTAYFAWWEG